jgi:hypothetical protein
MPRRMGGSLGGWGRAHKIVSLTAPALSVCPARPLETTFGGAASVSHHDATLQLAATGANAGYLLVFFISGLSCKTMFNSEVWTSSFPLYSIKPNLRNLFMKKLTRARVVPIISANVC